MVSEKDVAEICGVSIQKVRIACKSGEIRAQRNQKGWLSAKSEIETNLLCQDWLKGEQNQVQHLEETCEVLGQNTVLMKRLAEFQRKRDGLD